MKTRSRISAFLLLWTLVFNLLVLRQVSAQEWATAALEKSPRHGEWIEVRQGERTLRCFVVFPEVKGKAPAVIVIHEIFGLTDWARSLADQLAAAGYIAIAPDLISGTTAGAAPAQTPSQDEARRS